MSGITRNRKTIGSYLTQGGATVLVIDRSETHGNSTHTAIVSTHCGGHGCPADAPIEHGSARYISMIDTDEQVASTARTVQEWAQAHAEVCRATPAPGKHPADADLPICGHPKPDTADRTCQLTACHDWPQRQHAAYTGGFYGYIDRWDEEPARV